PHKCHAETGPLSAPRLAAVKLLNGATAYTRRRIPESGRWTRVLPDAGPSARLTSRDNGAWVGMRMRTAQFHYHDFWWAEKPHRHHRDPNPSTRIPLHALMAPGATDIPPGTVCA